MWGRGTKKKSNTEDVAVAQIWKYCDYYVNVCIHRDDMSKALEQMQQRAYDKETGNPIAHCCYCRRCCCCSSCVFFHLFFPSQCTLPLTAGARWQLASVWWRLEEISSLPAVAVAPALAKWRGAAEPPAVSLHQQVDATHTAAGRSLGVAN